MIFLFHIVINLASDKEGHQSNTNQYHSKLQYDHCLLYLSLLVDKLLPSNPDWLLFPPPTHLHRPNVFHRSDWNHWLQCQQYRWSLLLMVSWVGVAVVDGHLSIKCLKSFFDLYHFQHSHAKGKNLIESHVYKSHSGARAIWMLGGGADFSLRFFRQKQWKDIIMRTVKIFSSWGALT